MHSRLNRVKCKSQFSFKDYAYLYIINSHLKKNEIIIHSDFFNSLDWMIPIPFSFMYFGI